MPQAALSVAQDALLVRIAALVAQLVVSRDDLRVALPVPADSSAVRSVASLDDPRGALLVPDDCLAVRLADGHW